jgi:hypothetical protein
MIMAFIAEFGWHRLCCCAMYAGTACDVLPGHKAICLQWQCPYVENQMQQQAIHLIL